MADTRKIKLTKEALLDAIDTTATYIEAADKLGVTWWTFYRRMSDFGLKRHKRPHKLRVDGYWNYTLPKNHRRIMEEKLGRVLLPREHVHHIDGVKTNNDPDQNLVVADGPREHNAIHNSLQECAFELYRRGSLKFDHATKRYFLP